MKMARGDKSELATSVEPHSASGGPGRAPWGALLGGLALALTAALCLNDFTTPTFVAAQDKIEHLVAFAAVGFLFAEGALGRGIDRTGALWLALWLVAAAAAIELGQSVFTATREADAWDFGASFVGLALGFALAFASVTLRRRLARAS